MNYETILTTIENGICIITINRPDKLNALNKQVFTELEQAIEEVQTNTAIRSAIITGAGPKAFVAGADIAEFSAYTRQEAIRLSRRGQQIFSKIEHSTKPIIAAVNGFALGGGCELAMACHFRIASENARFGQPEVNLGVIPGYGGTQRLTSIVGTGKSMEMNLTGNPISAAEALEYRLVNYVVPANELMQKCIDILNTINAKAPIAIAKIITCINISKDPEVNGYNAEANAFGECFATNDMQEGINAFFEKRKPQFSGT